MKRIPRVSCPLLGVSEFIRQSNLQYPDLGTNDTQDGKFESSNSFVLLFSCAHHASGTERRRATGVSRSVGYRLSDTASQPSHDRSFHISPGWRRAARHGAAPDSQPRMIHIIYSRVCPKNPCHGMSAGHLPHCWLLPGESTAGKRQS